MKSFENLSSILFVEYYLNRHPRRWRSIGTVISYLVVTLNLSENEKLMSFI